MLALDIQTRVGDLSLQVTAEVGDGVSALFGPSGCGKTTLLRAIAGLTPCNGEMRFNQTIWQGPNVFVPLHERRVGYVFQDDRLFPHLTVGENLSYGLERAAKKVPIELPMTEVVDHFDLEPLLHRYPSTLSGGESRRVNIGRALCSQPKLLLLDEPLTGLDGRRKAEIIPYLATVAKDLNIPAVYVSHINDEIAQLCDQMMVMAEGTLIDHGPTDSVLNRLWQTQGQEQPVGEPGSLLNAQVSGFDDAKAMLHLSVAGQALQVICPVLPQVDRLRLFIAAADVAIGLDKPSRLSIRNTLSGTITQLRPLSGAKFGLVAVDIELPAIDNPQTIVAHISAAACEDLGLSRGMPVYALIKSARITTPLI